MKSTTLCYIEKDNKYLMIHRTKLKNDINHDKWLGIGGKKENGETPQMCNAREVREETGLILKNCKYRGIVYFISDIYEDEEMHLFYANDFSGELTECDEGNLEWVNKDKITSLPIWEGDKIFLHLLDTDEPFFKLTLNYKNDTLISAVLNDKQLKI